MLRFLCSLGALLVAAPSPAQVWVAPRRPGQTAVRYDTHDWHTIDLLANEDIAGTAAGGVRLFFYEQEREVAERAAAHIVDAYRTLADAFDYVPERRFPYVLYNSYAEFLRTNLFPLQEGTLGVTSTTSLELTLPYFGDHGLFTEVGTHEMAHQFTIQKVRSASAHAGAPRDPLPHVPLWFIEGLAEYYAQGGLSGRNAMLVRDLVTNPDPYLGHGLLHFYDDAPWSVLWTYQVGLARVTFLEQTYGEGTLQAILEASPWLVGSTSTFLLPGRRFSKLVERVTGDDRDTVDAKFDAWIKRASFARWLDADPASPAFTPIGAVRGYLTSFDASTDGHIVGYRAIEPETGRTRLLVAPRAAPTRTRRVAAEGRPGAESLHPIDPRSFDVDDARMVWVAESRGADTLVVRALARTVRAPRVESEEEATSAPAPVGPPLDDAEPWAVTNWALSSAQDRDPNAPVERIRLGPARRYRMARAGVVAVYSPSIGPDGRIAFVGLHDDGQRDIFVFDPESAPDGRLVRLTHDPHAERTLTWHGADIVFSSDATAHGHFNLFRVPADASAPPHRLTTAPHDHSSPVGLRDGRLFFVGWTDDAANLYELVAGEVVQRTDVTTGLFEPAPAPDGLTALVHQGGVRAPVTLPEDTLLSIPIAAQPQDGGPAPVPTRDLDAATPYAGSSPKNWRPDNVFGVVAAGPGGIFGQVFASASDVLRDRALLLNGTFFGTFQLTDGYLLYLDSSRRFTWGGGPFQALRFRIDRTAHPSLPLRTAERFYGGMLSGRYPLDRFVYLQLDQGIGAASYFFPFDDADTRSFLADGARNGTGEDLLDDWEASWGQARFQTESTLRVGVDTVRYHRKTGPVAGLSLLVEGSGGVQPFQDQVFTSGRLDGQAYLPLPLGSGSNLGFKGSVGTSGGGPVARSFFLSSYDTLRGAYYGDTDVLLGRHFWFTSGELQVPLDAVVRTVLASTIEGVAGVDAGGVADAIDQLWDARVLDVVVGGNVVIGPMVFRVHLGRALDVGATLPVPAGQAQWVPNLSLTWLQL